MHDEIRNCANLDFEELFRIHCLTRAKEPIAFVNDLGLRLAKVRGITGGCMRMSKEKYGHEDNNILLSLIYDVYEGEISMIAIV